MKSEGTIDQRIVEAYADVVRKEKIIIHLAHLKKQIEEDQIRLGILQQTMKKQEAEYLRLEKGGIQRFFFSDSDAASASLDREKQEFLLAYLKYQECEKALKNALQEQKILMESLYHLFEIEKKLDQLLVEKRRRLSSKSAAFPPAIEGFEKNIIRNQLQLKEIQEAQEIGKMLLPKLKKVQYELAEVKKVGLIDYHGKGRYSSYKKKKFIEKTTQEISNINSQLRVFQQELQDVATHYDLAYEQELKLFKNFLDDFFQKLISDWGIRKQISQSLLAIDNLSKKIEATLNNLERDVEQVRFLISNDQERVKALLLKMARKNDTPD